MAVELQLVLSEMHLDNQNQMINLLLSKDLEQRIKLVKLQEQINKVLLVQADFLHNHRQQHLKQDFFLQKVINRKQGVSLEHKQEHLHH